MQDNLSELKSGSSSDDAAMVANQSSKTTLNWGVIVSVASGRIDDDWNCSCMHWRKSNIDRPDGARLPAWNLLSICDGLVENVNQTTKYMDVMWKLLRGQRPCLKMS
jgi:hypothetical protein